jgi:hypothetical protein
VRYLVILFLIALLAACGTSSAVSPTTTPASPTPVGAIQDVTPTASPVVLAALATGAPVPTSAPEPTAKPAAAPAPTVPKLAGAAPQGSDCPADHPVKGNIVDRGENKGDKIYHLPSSSSYKATKPERCFVDAAEAEAAGFRAPK